MAGSNKVTPLVIPTGDGCGQNIAFSPDYNQSKLLACVTGDNYGLSGQGNLCIYEANYDTSHVKLAQNASWDDVLLDVVWRPQEQNNHRTLATCSGDGHIQIWQLANLRVPQSCTQVAKHDKEVSSLQWAKYDQDKIISGSWDGSVRLWNVETLSSGPIQLAHSHDDLVFDIRLSPLNPELLAIASGAGKAAVHDLRASKTVMDFMHGTPVLSCDWTSVLCSRPMLITGSKDGVIREWDQRKPEMPVRTWEGHTQAVRKIRCIEEKQIVVSASYDFTTRFWNLYKSDQEEVCSHHTEFVYGLDCHMNMICDCAWDKTISMYPTKLVTY